MRKDFTSRRGSRGTRIDLQVRSRDFLLRAVMRPTLAAQERKPSEKRKTRRTLSLRRILTFRMKTMGVVRRAKSSIVCVMLRAGITALTEMHLGGVEIVPASLMSNRDPTGRQPKTIKHIAVMT